MSDNDVKFKSLVVKESDREFSKNIGDDSFTVRIPLPYQKTTIIASTSRALGGANTDSISVSEREYVRMIITLNHVVVKSPPWWDGAETCPNDEFLNEIWEFYLSSERKFFSDLKKNTKGKILGKPE